VIFYSDPSFPVWARVLITAAAVVTFVLFAWQYYVRFWRRR
jgi:hypothetical protein